MPCVVLPLAMPIVVASSHVRLVGTASGLRRRSPARGKGSGGADGPCALSAARAKTALTRPTRTPPRARPAATASITEARVQVVLPVAGTVEPRRAANATPGEGQGPTRAFPPTEHPAGRASVGPPGSTRRSGLCRWDSEPGPGPAGAARWGFPVQGFALPLKVAVRLR